MLHCILLVACQNNALFVVLPRITSFKFPGTFQDPPARLISRTSFISLQSSNPLEAPVEFEVRVEIVLRWVLGWVLRWGGGGGTKTNDWCGSARWSLLGQSTTLSPCLSRTIQYNPPSLRRHAAPFKVFIGSEVTGSRLICHI